MKSLGTLLTLPQAARRLGISERTMHDVLKKRGVGLVRFGGGWPRVRERDVSKLIEELPRSPGDPGRGPRGVR